MYLLPSPRQYSRSAPPEKGPGADEGLRGPLSGKAEGVDYIPWLRDFNQGNQLVLFSYHELVSEAPQSFHDGLNSRMGFLKLRGIKFNHNLGMQSTNCFQPATQDSFLMAFHIDLDEAYRCDLLLHAE